MQPPAARSKREGRWSSTSSAGRSSSGGGIAPSTNNGRRNSTSGGGGGQQLATVACGGGAAAAPALASLPPPETRTLLSGSLSRCSPVFSASSDTVFCACSSSVLGISVETGEELLRLVGHSKDVTAMLVLPPGAYGAAGGGPAPASARRECLLTSSVDGTLRLWDASADLMSLEGEAERCLRVLNVGMPVHHVFLGRQDSSGTALDVIVVTKEGTASLHGLKDGGGDGGGSGDNNKAAPKKPAAGAVAKSSNSTADNDDDDDDDDNLTSGEDDHSSDDDTDDEEEEEDEVVEVDAKEIKNAPAEQGKKGGAGHGSRGGTGGSVVGAGGGGRKKGGAGGKKGNQRLFDWQAVRYGLAEGAAQAVLLVSKQQYRWIGATAPRSPIISSRSSSGGGSNKRGVVCPVLLSADGRVVTAVDAGTGDKAVLLTGMAPVRSLAVGGNGETLVTGHLDGSMSQWHELSQRLGSAFRVSGFEAAAAAGAGAGAEPSTDMHWHAYPVRCMAVAPDGVQLFSGGEEAVLVQWNLRKGTQAFLPRLGAPLQGIAVSPGHEYAVATTRDNAVTLVGLAGWDVMWQMRGLALSLSPPLPSSKLASAAERAARARQALKLTMGPTGGLVACNGRAGHVQFYNVATDCLEASAEVVRYNRDTSAKSWQSDQLAKRGRAKGDHAAAVAAAGAALGPVVEHVAFSADGERMVAVASRTLRRKSASTSLSFWRHARGSDPFGSSSGYNGGYSGACSTRGGVSGGGGTLGHWAPDTAVENPHGPGNAVAALEYHPREDVVVTAGSQDGSFNLWGLRRSENALESLAATSKSGGSGEHKGQEAQAVAVHWACSLSVRYKEGLTATGVSFCSDGSVLAVAYAPADRGGNHSGTDKGQLQVHSAGQGVITLWSLETVTLLFTLLPPRTRDLRPSSSSKPLKCLGFIAGSGRVLAAGSGYAAVWDMVSPETTPLWEYRARVLAAARADTVSVLRSGTAGVSVEGKGVGDVALCVDAASLTGKSGRDRGSVVLLLNSSNPTPLYTWRLPGDMPTSLKLLLDSGGGREGVLCLTRRGELLMLSVASPEDDGGKAVSVPRRPQPQQQYNQQHGAGGLGVVRIKHGASAPALHLSAASKRALLAVDLAGSDPALASAGGGSGKRPRVDLDGEEEEDDGHAGGREAMLRSGQRASDVLDPSTVNLAPVPDMYQAFMRTLLKPAPQQQQQQQQQPRRVAGGAPLSLADATLLTAGGGAGGASKGRRGKRGGERGLVSPPSVMEEGLLSMLSKKLKA
eukprot:g15909.t1